MDGRVILGSMTVSLQRLGDELAGAALRLAHEVDGRWRGLPVDARRKLVGLPVSALLHGLVLLALLSTPAARQLGLGPSLEQGGRADAHNGRGLSVSLVSLADLGEIGRDRPSTASATPGGGAIAKSEVSARPMVRVVESPFVAGGSAQSGQTAPRPVDDQRMAAAAAAAQGQNLVDTIQSGDADDGQNLLRQIGRCLPPDHRPVLDGVKLALQLGPDGQLAAAPSLDITPALASKDTIREANLVVQAALQCGPYQVANPAVGAYAVAADFAFMGPPGSAAPRVMPHGR